MHVRVVDLEDGLDPDEYCRQHGAETYRARLDQAKNYFYWLADRARTKFDMRSAEGRVAAFQFLLPAVQSLGDKIERVAVANDVAGYLGVDSGLVLENFRKAAAERSEKRLAAVKDTLRIDEKILLNLLLMDGEARRRLIPELQSAQAVEQFATRRIFRALFALEASGGSVSFAALDARLEENDRELLASAALSGETNEEILSLENGIRCLDRMRKAAYEARIASLQAQLKQAERGGNLEEAMRLAEEVSRLKSDWLPGKEYQKQRQ